MRSVPRMTWQLTFSRVQPASPNGLSGLNFGCLRHDCFQKCFKWAHTRSHTWHAPAHIMGFEAAPCQCNCHFPSLQHAPPAIPAISLHVHASLTPQHACMHAPHHTTCAPSRLTWLLQAAAGVDSGRVVSRSRTEQKLGELWRWVLSSLVVAS